MTVSGAVWRRSILRTRFPPRPACLWLRFYSAGGEQRLVFWPWHYPVLEEACAVTRGFHEELRLLRSDLHLQFGPTSHKVKKVSLSVAGVTYLCHKSCGLSSACFKAPPFSSHLFRKLSNTARPATVCLVVNSCCSCCLS